MKIVTRYAPPPIGSRAFDCWSAVDADTYDISGVDEEGIPYGNGPVGYGATEAEAIADLKEQMEQ